MNPYFTSYRVEIRSRTGVQRRIIYPFDEGSDSGTISIGKGGISFNLKSAPFEELGKTHRAVGADHVPPPPPAAEVRRTELQNHQVIARRDGAGDEVVIRAKGGERLTLPQERGGDRFFLSATDWSLPAGVDAAAWIVCEYGSGSTRILYIVGKRRGRLDLLLKTTIADGARCPPEVVDLRGDRVPEILTLERRVSLRSGKLSREFDPDKSLCAVWEWSRTEERYRKAAAVPYSRRLRANTK